MAKIPIGTALTESFGFVQPGWSKAWGAMAVVVIVNTGAQFLQGVIATGGLGVALLVLVVQTLAGTLAAGALYRIALAPDHGSDYQRDNPVRLFHCDYEFRPGPAGMQWGSLEWRVLGANVIVGLIIGVVSFVFLIAWAIGLGVMVAGHMIDMGPLQSAGLQGREAVLAAFGQLLLGPAGLLTLAILGPGLAIILYLSARLSLYAVAAADSGSFDMGWAWSLTKGATGAILVTLISYFLFAWVLAMVFGLLGGFLAKAAGFAGARQAAAIAGAAIGAALGAPLIAGLVTYVYRTERGGGASVAEQFS